MVVNTRIHESTYINRTIIGGVIVPLAGAHLTYSTRFCILGGECLQADGDED